MEDKSKTNVDNIKYESLSESERHLILYIRRLSWGSLEVLVQRGKPVMIKQAMKTIKLIDTRQ